MRLPSVLVLSLVGVTVLGVSFAAQNKGDSGKTPPPAAGKPAQAPGEDQTGMPEMDMEKWAAYAALGAEHQLLQTRVGKWTATTKMWMAPGAPPEESTGTSEIKSLMDGRYIQDEMHGSMMGAAFHGIGIAGYDNLKKKYVSTWIDNMGTGIMMMEGTHDPATKTLTYRGMMPDPASGEFLPTRMVERADSADQLSMEMHCTGPDGKEFKTMEIVYKRSK